MRKILIAFFLTLSFFKAEAQFWQQTNGPEGGKVSVLEVNRSTGDLFIGFSFPYLFGNNGASGKIFRSSDEGFTWTSADNGITRHEMLQIALQPGSAVNLFAILQDTLKPIPYTYAVPGFLKCANSSDNGNSWTIVNGNHFPTDDWPVALVSNSTGQLFAARSKYAATAIGGVDVSSDNGASWTSLNTGLPNTKMKSLAVGFNDHLFAGTDSVSPSFAGNVYEYDGTSWSSTNLSGPGVTVLTYDGNSSTLYSGTQSGATGRIYKSVSGGPWILLSNYPGYSFSKIKTGPSGDLYVSTFSAGVFYSQDGTAWTALTTSGLTAITNLHQLMVDNSNDVFVTDWDGILKTTLTGTSWTRFNNGLICTSTKGFTFNNSSQLLVAGQNGIDMSSDYGNTWTRITINGKPLWSVGRNQAGDLFASTASAPPYVFRSTTGGSAGSWIQSDAGMGGTLATFFDYDNSGILYFGGGWVRQVYKSTNTAGTTWTPNTVMAQSGLPQNTVTTAIAINRNSTGQDIFTGMESVGVFRSSDGGQTYTSLGITGGDISSIKIAPGGDVWVAHAFTAGSGVYRSVNNGNSWSANMLPGRGVVNGLSIISDDSIFVATTTGVYLLDSTGTNVQQLNQGLAGLSVICLGIGPDNHLYAGVSGSGIHRSTLPVSGTPSGIENADLPFNVSTFPNPAHQSVTVQWNEIVLKNPVLEVYNITGQKILTSTVSRPNEISIDLNSFVPGIYAFTIFDISGFKITTGKFIVE